jgi:hypothetical protein
MLGKRFQSQPQLVGLHFEESLHAASSIPIEKFSARKAT